MLLEFCGKTDKDNLNRGAYMKKILEDIQQKFSKSTNNLQENVYNTFMQVNLYYNQEIGFQYYNYDNLNYGNQNFTAN